MHLTPLKNSNIYLTGFMGSGKSTVGRMLAERLHLKFIDADAVITSQADVSISEIFQNEGESGFRKRESAVIQALSRKTGIVLALGGGAFTIAENRKILSETGFSISLNFPPGILTARLSDDNSRPLLKGLSRTDKEMKISTMLQERLPFYQSADLVLDLKHETPSQICELIKDTLEQTDDNP